MNDGDKYEKTVYLSLFQSPRQWGKREEKTRAKNERFIFAFPSNFRAVSTI